MLFMVALMDPIQQILDEWYGPLDAEGRASPEKMARWFEKNEAFDRHLREHFLPWMERALAGQLTDWAAHDSGRVALILLLDQFTRNVYRGTARMFSGDSLALPLAQETKGPKHDASILPAHRSLTLMPLMHSEALADQEDCVAAFERLAGTGPAAHRPSHEYGLNFAVAHRDIIARFGRFPHRNAILGRPSTAEERTFLEQPGSSF